MVREVAVLTVHGINVTATGYSAGFRRALTNALPKVLRPYLYFDEVYWADIIRGRQQGFLNRALQLNVRPSRYRDMAMQALGDAAAYQKTKERRNSAYYEIQRRLLDKLRETALNVPRETPLILVGHSLGCHIVSSFAWDVHKLKGAPAEIGADGGSEFASAIADAPPLVRLDTFAGFVTLGNNMPLFTFTFGPSEVHPITHAWRPGMAPAFPGPGLSEDVRARAEWLNIYSPNDPLGFPLKPLNDGYRNEPRLTEIAHRVEHWWWPNPYDAHVRYWVDKRVQRETARVVAAIMRADEPKPEIEPTTTRD